MPDEIILDYVRRLREIKHQCFNLIISKKDPTDLDFVGSRSYVKEKLAEHFKFLSINQLLQKVSAVESWHYARESHKSHCPNMFTIEYQSDNLDDETIDFLLLNFYG